MTTQNKQKTPDPRFNFFERVKVTSRDTAKSHMNGYIGTVLGRTPTEDEKFWYYAVSIDSEEITWAFFEDELESLGEYSKYEDFYDGTSIRVRVDEKGRGIVVPKEDSVDDS